MMPNLHRYIGSVGPEKDRMMLEDIKRFSEQSGLVPSRKRPDLHYLVGEPCPQDRGGRSSEDCHLLPDDRPSLWPRDGKIVAYIANPYHVDHGGYESLSKPHIFQAGTEFWEKVIRFDLVVDISERTWRYPGKSVRIVAYFEGTIPKRAFADKTYRL